MRGLMMPYQLTVPAILRRAVTFSNDVEIVSREDDGTLFRYRYRELASQSRRLARLLESYGIRQGDRVATLAWNHRRHLEAYFAIPSYGAVLHPLNLRLHADDLAYIIEHAGDRVLLVDKCLLPLFEQFRSRVRLEHVLVFEGGADTPAGALDYDDALSTVDDDFEFPDVDEYSAASMCYTSGTTGRPKGVLYSHRTIVLIALYWTAADAAAVSRRDVIMGVVPMFHINGWCLPYAAANAGSKLVLPGSQLSAKDLLSLIASERVTLSAGVPTIWLSVLHALTDSPSSYDLSTLRQVVVGGAAMPEALARGFSERYNVTVTQAWGMTETTALASVSTPAAETASLPAAAQRQWLGRQGIPMPFVEIRAIGADGLVPWDGATTGELEVRGPTVVDGYFNTDEHGGFTSDGWFRTGDIVTIDSHGSIQIRDRAKDLIKSGGEWISSVALENALVEHASVAEAAVIAIPDERWGERPLAVVVLRPGAVATEDDLRGHLAPRFAKWCLPDGFAFVDEIPKTGTGKFLKTVLRERFRDRGNVK